MNGGGSQYFSPQFLVSAHYAMLVFPKQIMQCNSSTLKKTNKKNAHSALNTLSEFMQHAEHRTGGNLNNQPYGPTAPLVSLCRDATKIISTSNV